jgi:hypothetical protein
VVRRMKSTPRCLSSSGCAAKCDSLVTEDGTWFTGPLVSSGSFVVRDNSSFIPSEETTVIREKTNDRGLMMLRSDKQLIVYGQGVLLRTPVKKKDESILQTQTILRCMAWVTASRRLCVCSFWLMWCRWFRNVCSVIPSLREISVEFLPTENICRISLSC